MSFYRNVNIKNFLTNLIFWGGSFTVIVVYYNKELTFFIFEFLNWIKLIFKIWFFIHNTSFFEFYRLKNIPFEDTYDIGLLLWLIACTYLIMWVLLIGLISQCFILYFYKNLILSISKKELNYLSGFCNVKNSGLKITFLYSIKVVLIRCFFIFLKEYLTAIIPFITVITVIMIPLYTVL